MSEINTLPEQEAIERIVETMRQVDAGKAPFALVLGAGFSHGLVPTAREVVTESLPAWIYALNEGNSFPFKGETSAKQQPDIARNF